MLHARAAAAGAVMARAMRPPPRGAALIQALGSTRSPARLAALRRVLGAYALDRKSVV